MRKKKRKHGIWEANTSDAAGAELSLCQSYCIVKNPQPQQISQMNTINDDSYLRAVLC